MYDRDTLSARRDSTRIKLPRSEKCAITGKRLASSGFPYMVLSFFNTVIIATNCF